MSAVPRIRLAKLDAKVAAVERLLAPHPMITKQAVDAIIVSLSMAGLDDIEELPTENVRSTLLQYVGKPFTPRIRNLVARQLVVRVDMLAALPLPIVQTVIPGWAAIEIVGAKPIPWKDVGGHEFTFYILTGHMAGSLFHRKFPDSWLRGLAYRVGYSRRTVYDDDPKSFIGFRLWVDAVASEFDGRQPEIQDVVVDNQMKKHNKAIIVRRTRFDKVITDEDPCPIEAEHECRECTKTCYECCASFTRTIHG